MRVSCTTAEAGTTHLHYQPSEYGRQTIVEICMRLEVHVSEQQVASLEGGTIIVEAPVHGVEPSMAVPVGARYTPRWN